MDPKADATGVAARIADGSAIDWTEATSAADSPADRALLDQLRTIADVATLHRAPRDWFVAPAQPKPEIWGPLTILSSIGAGRFGDVYSAWDARLQRRVALKLQKAPTPLASPTAAIDEARLLARVRNPNVLTVFGAESIDGRVGIWTEFIEGRTLDALVAERGPLPPAEVAAIGADLAGALQAVHGAGLLHRDIKPQNVVRETGGRIVLMDFGTGHDLAMAPARPGDLSGTPLYLAPEVLAGGAPSQASDIYALGVVLFYLLTGTHPVVGKTLGEVKAGHGDGAPRRLSDLRPGLPSHLVSAIERAMSPDPRARFADANGFKSALRAAPARPRRLFVVLAATLTAAAAVAAFFATRTDPEFRDPPDLHMPPAGNTAAVTVRELLLPEDADSVGRPSRDGRYVPFVRDKDVWIRELAHNTDWQATHLDGKSAVDPLMSPTGDRVVFTVTTNDGSELRMVNVDGTASSVLIPMQVGGVPYTLEWNQDGTSILCLITREDGDSNLVLTSAKEATSVVLRTFHGMAPRSASLSPDGRLLVYDVPRDAPSGRRQVRIAGVPGVDPTADQVLLAGQSHDLMPSWTRDGGGVFFLSDRPGSVEGYVVPVEKGRPTDSPIQVLKHLNRARSGTFLDDGRYFVQVEANDQNVYKIAIDGHGVRPETKAVVSPVRSRSHNSPAWSRDGRISYITRSGRTSLDSDTSVLTIQDPATGRERLVPLALWSLGVMAPRWSPDGRTLLVRGRKDERTVGFFHVDDLRTGHLSPIVTWPLADNELYGFFAWAPDGQRILYLKRPVGIVSHGLSPSDPETVVIPGPGIRWSVVVSPDGTSIAFATATSPTNSGPPTEMNIEVANLDGSLRRRVHTIPLPTNIVIDAWTNDNRLLYTAFPGASNLPSRLYSIAVSGGAPTDMGLTIDALTQANRIALSPDNKWLAFTEGYIEDKIYVVDKFLPELGSKKR